MSWDSNICEPGRLRADVEVGVAGRSQEDSTLPLQGGSKSLLGKIKWLHRHEFHSIHFFLETVLRES